MDTALLLARLQFGLTLTYHFWFVALTLGLSILIALMETQYVRTGKQKFKAMTKYWGRFFLINYAVAIVTGLVNEFQFGMNWSEYSRFVGSTFGPPLAFEAVTAFFVESVAIGIWVYGWSSVSRRVHLVTIWLVAWSSNYSAFWILAANSFMQYPVGYSMQRGRLELADLTSLITNPYLMHQYSHVFLTGLATAGIFLLAVSSYYLLRSEHVEVFRRSFAMGLYSALFASALLIVSGHFYNQFLADVQPMKFAATEALWETAKPAPLVIVSLIDEDKQKNTYELSIPGGLSLLAHNSRKAEIKGMRELQTKQTASYGPGSYIPPVTLLFWSFRIMVGIGVWLFFLLATVWWYNRTGGIQSKPILLKLLMWSLPLPYIAIMTGWIITEVGRQPWAVYGILLTERGISRTVPAASVWTSLILYGVIYSCVAVIALYLARKTILTGPQLEIQNE